MKLTSKSPAPDRSVLMLIAGALGAALFTLCCGFLLYRSMQGLVTATAWVEHTQEVLIAVQRGSQLLDRIDAGTRMHTLNGDDGQLASARLSSNTLVQTSLHLKSLTADNSNEVQNMQQLNACALFLADDLKISGHTRNPADEEALFKCRETLGRMSEQERMLLKTRSEASRQTTTMSFVAQGVFVALALTALGLLFWMLMRHTLARKRLSEGLVEANNNLQQSIGELQRQALESRVLTLMRDELQLCISPEDVYRSAASFTSQLIEGSSGSLCIINSSRNRVECVSAWPSAGDSDREPMQDIFAPEDCCGLRLGQMRWRRPGASELDCAHFAGDAPREYLCIPLAAHGETLGILHLECSRPEVSARVSERMDSLREMLQLTAMSIASLRLRVRLENHSIKDSLTGVFNRHFMEIALERELARATRRKTTGAILMLDVDHFKRLNDRHGHSAGDRMLQEVARVLKQSVRTDDVVCRYGGEEFTIILPEISAPDALVRANVVREAVAGVGLLVDDDNAVGATVSIGVAMYPRDGMNAEPLLREADLALYSAKRAGRNRVVDAAAMKGAEAVLA